MKMPEKSTKLPSWITPFKKQCFVTMGMSLNMAQMGLVMGYSSVLVPQLKLPESAIPIDDDYGSWIAALPAISVMIGNLTVPFIMGTLGRKVANLTTLVLSAVGWICIVLSTNILLLLAARFFQGIAMGMTATLGPLLIGEYTSPVNRGAFLMTISITIGIGVLAIHSMGSYLLWQTVALICIALIIINLAMVIMSPESPSWLADQGRYEECKVVFRWLRGDSEEDELSKLLEASTALRRIKDEEKNRPVETLAIRIKNNLRYFGQTVRKNEFIKPIIIMIHIYALAHWTGVNILASYAVIFIKTAIGGDVDIPNIMLSLDINRSIFNTIALIVIRKIKRRTVLLTTVSLNILALVIVAGYTFAKANGFVTFDPYYSFWVGIVLIHFLTFTIAIGALPMSFVLGGELFPLQYKSLAGGVSCVSFSLHIFTTIKTVPALLDSVNIYGVYLVYCCILVYSLIVVGIMLPETKDKTLQEIENEFRGHKKQPVEEKIKSFP